MALISEIPGLVQGTPGRRREGDDLAPVFRIEVNDAPILEDINQFISSVEFESAVDMADLFRIVIENPGVVDGAHPDWTAHKAFQQGNEASLFVGYGGAERPENFVGRACWAKHLPFYPREGMPQLELKGYDLSHKLMDAEGRLFTTQRQGCGITRLAQPRPVDQNDDQGIVFRNVLHSDVVFFFADMYGLDLDLDPTTRPENVVAKKGTKHWEVIKSLGNINNREVWIDYDLRKRNWVLHWKVLNRDQRPEFIFRYNAGDQGTLLEAEPEYGLRETITQATILIFDEKNQRWVSAIEIEEAAGPDPTFSPGGGLRARATPSRNPKAKRKKGRPRSEGKHTAARTQDQQIISEALDNASAFRIAAEGVAIDVLPPGRRFRDPEEAARYLLRWFREKQDNFITMTGLVIGVESLRARQTHTLAGLGTRLSGDYFFTRVRHVLNDAGYVCEFTANHVIVN